MITLKKLLYIKTIYKFYILFLVDLFSSILSLYITLAILKQSYFINIFEFQTLMIISSFIFLPIFHTLDLYKNMLRFSNFNLIFKILFCIIINFLSLFFLNYFLNFVDKSFIFLLFYSVFFFILLINSRLLIIYLINDLYSMKNGLALIYGAGEAGTLILNQIKNYKIKYFIDDDVNKIGRKIDSIKIISSSRLEEIITNTNISCIFLAIPSLNNSKRQNILSFLSKFNVQIKTMPRIDDILYKNQPLSDFNFLFSDLFYRNINWRHDELFESTKNKTIVVTGAGGSIGSELVRQLSKLSLSKLICIDNSEYNLFNVSQEITRYLKKTNKKLHVQYFLVDLYDNKRLDSVFFTQKPNLVFHAAAYKHVGLLEDNKIESLKNNVLATLNVAKIADRNKVEKFINISTDKAVNPSSIMGASKRLSELLLLNYKTTKTNISIVRFGNVINSNGSVLPIFNKQISEGGPLTVTDKDVTRYFMSIEEAAGLVLESSLFAKNKDIHILDMGKPIKIIDLAIKMINFSGKKYSYLPDKDSIQIIFTGLKKGEKMHEQLSHENKFSETINKFIFKDESNYNEKIDVEKLEDILKNILLSQDDIQVSQIYKEYIKDNIL